MTFYTNRLKKKKGLANQDESAVQQRNERAMLEMKSELKVNGFVLVGLLQRDRTSRRPVYLSVYLSMYLSVYPSNALPIFQL